MVVVVAILTPSTAQQTTIQEARLWREAEAAEALAAAALVAALVVAAHHIKSLVRMAVAVAAVEEPHLRRLRRHNPTPKTSNATRSTSLNPTPLTTYTRGRTTQNSSLRRKQVCCCCCFDLYFA
jgi:hypothetical protein